MPMRAKFVEPMLLCGPRSCRRARNGAWSYKLDGYRALAIKSGGKVQLRSRNDNDFSLRYPARCSLKPKDWNACFFSARSATSTGTNFPCLRMPVQCFAQSPFSRLYLGLMAGRARQESGGRRRRLFFRGADAARIRLTLAPAENYLFPSGRLARCSGT